jgi:tRNA threonylcarbamoyladenosine biosynthesis protein TsaB
VADASKLLQVEDASSWCGAGRGFRAYPELRALLGLAGGQFYDELLPSAADIARLAVSDFGRGLAVSAASALPVYLRDDVAAALPRR